MPVHKSEKTKEFLKYEFTHDEIHEKGIELARISSEAVSIENERKAIAAEYKAKIESKEAQIGVLGNHINNGYEYRYIACTIIFNHPTPGLKETRRDDTGEVVKTEPMTAEEMQYELDLKDYGEIRQIPKPYEPSEDKD